MSDLHTYTQLYPQINLYNYQWQLPSLFFLFYPLSLSSVETCVSLSSKESDTSLRALSVWETIF